MNNILIIIIWQIFNYTGLPYKSDTRSVRKQLSIVFTKYDFVEYEAEPVPMADITWPGIFKTNHHLLEKDQVNLFIVPSMHKDYIGLAHVGSYMRYKGIAIVEQYGTRRERRALILHEVLHNFNADHLNHSSCVMYPVITGKRRICEATRRAVKRFLRRGHNLK